MDPVETPKRTAFNTTRSPAVCRKVPPPATEPVWRPATVRLPPIPAVPPLSMTAWSPSKGTTPPVQFPATEKSPVAADQVISAPDEIPEAKTAAVEAKESKAPRRER